MNKIFSQTFWLLYTSLLITGCGEEEKTTDTGVSDTNTTDTADTQDTNDSEDTSDSGTTDTGFTDTGSSDTGTTDSADTGVVDSGVVDSGDSGDSGDTGDTENIGPGPNAVVDFSLPDTNPQSPTVGQTVSPRDYLQQVSGWYFIKAT